MTVCTEKYKNLQQLRHEHLINKKANKSKAADCSAYHLPVCMTYHLNLVDHIAVSWLPHCFALHNHSTVAVCSLFIGIVHFNWTYFQFLCMLLRDNISNSGKAGLVIHPPTPACRHCAHSIGQMWPGHHLGFCKKSSSDLL